VATKKAKRSRKTRAPTVALVTVEPWADVHDVSNHTGLSVSTIKRLVIKNAIPCTRVGDRVLFKRSLVDSALIKLSESLKPK
jgi:excisionase family DNA binding protein